MSNIYDYQKNIKISKTMNDDVIVTMNKPILIELINIVYDAIEYRKSQRYTATAERTKELWTALYEKEDAMHLTNDFSTIRRLISKKNNLTDAEKDVLIEMLSEGKGV